MESRTESGHYAAYRLLLAAESDVLDALWHLGKRGTIRNAVVQAMDGIACALTEIEEQHGHGQSIELRCAE